MACMNQVLKKRIADKIKPLLKECGLKGTLSVDGQSTIILTIKSGEIDFMNNFSRMESRGFKLTELERKRSYINVNEFYIDREFTGKAKDFLIAAFDALKSAGWYDKSDSQVDHFNTAYYIDIKIGNNEKPYILTAA